MIKSQLPQKAAAIALVFGGTLFIIVDGKSPFNISAQRIGDQMDMMLIAQRQDGRSCREVVENDRKVNKCCRTWTPLGGLDCVYN